MDFRMKSRLYVLGLTLALVAAGFAGSACNRSKPPAPTLSVTDLKVGRTYEVVVSEKVNIQLDPTSSATIPGRDFHFTGKDRGLRPQVAPLFTEGTTGQPTVEITNDPAVPLGHLVIVEIKGVAAEGFEFSNSKRILFRYHPRFPLQSQRYVRTITPRRV